MPRLTGRMLAGVTFARTCLNTCGTDLSHTTNRNLLKNPENENRQLSLDALHHLSMAFAIIVNAGPEAQRRFIRSARNYLTALECSTPVAEHGTKTSMPRQS